MEGIKKRPLVSICTLVYNHEPFLKECFEGFLMQKTNFAFEVLVHDDASTDNSAEIIREYTEKYPEIFKPIYQTENQYSKGIKISTTHQFPRAKGKYIAICEGDDYWTDPLKLQKQVDILESNDEFGCVYTAYKTVDTKSNPIEYLPSKYHMSRSYTGDIFYDLLVQNFPQTLTVLFRKDLLSYEFNPPYSLDFSLFLSFAIQKNFYYLPDITGAYRINPAGMVQSGELWKRFDFLAIEFYFFVEYLKSKHFKRDTTEDKRIKNILFEKKWCYVWKVKKKYHKYLIKIIWYAPQYIVTIPLYLCRRKLKRIFPKYFI